MADPNDQQVANPQGIRSGGSGNIIEHHIAVQRIKHELKEVLNSDEVIVTFEMYSFFKWLLKTSLRILFLLGRMVF